MPCRHTSLCCFTQGPICWHVWLKGGLKQGLSAYPTWDKKRTVFQNHLNLFHEIPSFEKLTPCLVSSLWCRPGWETAYWLRDAFAGKHGVTDLTEMHLQASMEGKSLGQAFGALIFTCNGRGRNLFNELSYDSRKIAEFIPVPSSGFLCNGESIQSETSQKLKSDEQLSMSCDKKTSTYHSMAALYFHTEFCVLEQHLMTLHSKVLMVHMYWTETLSRTVLCLCMTTDSL